MIKHIVAFNHKPEFSEKEKAENALKIKTMLEGLKGVIPEIVELRVYTNLCSTGDRDLLLDSVFESEESLKAYQVHPEHVQVSSFVRSVMQDRVCLDYAM